jgi:peptidoglycan/LPS O-acetylase OafA/YrhL
MGGGDVTGLRFARGRANRQLTAAMSAASTGFLGLAVLVIMLQGSGGFGVELLGPNLLLTVSGFVVTRALLDSAAPTGRIGVLTWYREQLTLNAPLLVLAPLAVFATAVFLGPYVHGGATVADLLTALVPTPEHWRELAARAELTGHIDPLGPLWLIGLLIQFSLVWPALLAGLYRVLDAGAGFRMVLVLTPALLTVTVAAWLVGPLRQLAGADLSELAMGGHVRVVEWLVGATAAAASVGLAQVHRRTTRWEAPALAAVGSAVLVAMAVLATRWPAEWLSAGGAGAAAFGAAVLLLAVHVPADGPLARALGRGLPFELGRMAYPLLVLHAPIFWMVQLAVPSARPVALLAVGGGLTWMVGLVLHDGLVRRLRRMQLAWPRTVWPALGAVTATLAVAAIITGDQVANAAQDPRRPAGTPVALVLGGSYAGNIASLLDQPGGRYPVFDGSRAGCGLLPEPNPYEAAKYPTRTTAQAQAPGSVSQCADWQQRWASLMTAIGPAAVVLDLSADAAPRGPEATPPACTPAFRAQYRELFAAAVATVGDGQQRSILLVTNHRSILGADDGTRRCFNALLVEFAASYRSVAPLSMENHLSELRPQLDEFVAARTTPPG